MKRFLTTLILLTTLLYAQAKPAEERYLDDPYTVDIKQVILPVSLIAAASTALFITPVKEADESLQRSIVRNTVEFKIDGIMQYMPIIITLGLDVVGADSRHGFKEQTTNLAMAVAFTSILVNTGKYTICRPRPNGYENNSFPSWHTATAFMGAEFLRMEYGQNSPWIGVAGYGFAFATGYMRIRHNKHYPADVVAGAGVGILSVKLAYWCAPKIIDFLWGTDVRERRSRSGAYALLTPYSNGEQHGAGFSMQF